MEKLQKLYPKPALRLNPSEHSSYSMHHHVNIKLSAYIVFVFRMIVTINRNAFIKQH
jgi:hypothetical protein